MSSIGFHVWNPAGRLPTVVHSTFLAAWAEAGRLKQAHPGERFVVMMPCEDMSAIGYGLGWTRGRDEGLAQAHREIMRAEAHADRWCNELHALRQASTRTKPITERAADFQAIVADCLLWFDGFAAAFAGKASHKRPRVPERERIRQLNEALQGLLPHTVEHDLDDEIPF